MTDKIFDLEQRIMNCWNVVDDLDDLYYYFGDDPFFKDMDAKHREKICNLLLGMKEMYKIKFQKCIFDFEVLRERIGDCCVRSDTVLYKNGQ